MHKYATNAARRSTNPLPELRNFFDKRATVLDMMELLLFPPHIAATLFCFLQRIVCSTSDTVPFVSPTMQPIARSNPSTKQSKHEPIQARHRVSCLDSVQTQTQTRNTKQPKHDHEHTYTQLHHLPCAKKLFRKIDPNYNCIRRTVRVQRRLH